VRAPIGILLIALALGACSDDDGLDLSGPAQVDLPEVTVASGDLGELPVPTAPGTDDTGPVATAGGGTVTVNGVTYELTAQTCTSGADGTHVEGVADGSDGSTAWIVVRRSVTTRDDAAATMDAATVERLFGDRDVLDQTSVTVDVGRTSVDGGSPADQPSWDAVVGPVGRDGLTVEVTADGLRGSGDAEDFNAVAVAAGETGPIEFEVACG
jgi:hypothetical protein